MRAVAVHGVDVQVGCVRLGREAVIANVDPGTLDCDVLNIERVKEVGVLGKCGDVVRLRRAGNITESNVLGCKGSCQYSLIRSPSTGIKEAYRSQ